MLADSSDCSLVYSSSAAAASFLHSAFHLNQAAAPVMGGGGERRGGGQQFASRAGNEASCFLLGCTAGSSDTGGERRPVGRTGWPALAPGGAVFSRINRSRGAASCLIVGLKQNGLDLPTKLFFCPLNRPCVAAESLRLRRSTCCQGSPSKDR